MISRHTPHSIAFGTANQMASARSAAARNRCHSCDFLTNWLLDKAMRMGVRVEERCLPDGMCGLYHEGRSLIVLSDRLNWRQRRCTLQHEIIHAERHDVGCGTTYGVKEERRARRETALRLIDPVEYASAECVYGSCSFLLAVELGVTVQVVEDYRVLLRDGVVACRTV